MLTTRKAMIKLANGECIKEYHYPAYYRATKVGREVIVWKFFGFPSDETIRKLTSNWKEYNSLKGFKSEKKVFEEVTDV